MNSVENVKAICKERKIPISKLEKDLGFANGYISQLRKGVFPYDRLKKSQIIWMCLLIISTERRKPLHKKRILI